MKNIVTDNLNDIFDVESELVDDEPKQLVRPDFEETTLNLPDDVSKDYKFARDNLHDIIEKGTYALDNLLHLAKASEHPRAFEVVSQLTKTLVDANKDLLDIQKKVKELREEDNANPNSALNINNALFVGSTSELQKLISGEE
jgi:hypothetical protein|tara:strand:+ start:414 stop:842 length:429 start_codon:yes stop_codon:yes gene_type:complete